MPRWQRIYLSTCAGIIGYMLAYVATDYAKLPRLTYFQIERRWRLAAPRGGLASGFVGQWLFALAAAALVGGVAYLVLGRRRAPAGERALGLALAWTASAVVLAVGFYTWNNWP